MLNKLSTLSMALLMAMLLTLSACDNGGGETTNDTSETETTEESDTEQAKYKEVVLLPDAAKAKIPSDFSKIADNKLTKSENQADGLQRDYSKDGGRTTLIQAVKQEIEMPLSKLEEWKNSTIQQHKMNPDFRTLNEDKMVELAGQKWLLIDITMESEGNKMVLRQYGTGHNEEMLLLQVIYLEDEKAEYQEVVDTFEESLTLLNVEESE